MAGEAARSGSAVLADEAGDERVAQVATGGFDRLADSLIGGVTLHAHQFQWLTAIAVAAGVAVVATSLCRRPLHAWPEWVWLAAAAVALLPAVVFHPWLLVAGPLAALAAWAAVVHFLRRRDYTLGRVAVAAQASPLAPHVGVALDRGSDVAVAAARTSASAARRGAVLSAGAAAGLGRASHRAWRRRRAARAGIAPHEG